MINYIIRRILIAVPLLLAMSLVTFLAINLAPGNFFDSLRMDPQFSEETIKHYESLYHLDKPVIIQYLYWLKSLVKLDFGYSFFYNAPVKKVITSRLLNTLLLSAVSLIFTWLIAIPLGIIAAVNRNRFADRFFSFLAFIGLSIPNFFFALLLLYVASAWGILPLGGMRSAGFESLTILGKIFDIARHLIIPTIVISTSAFAGLQRLMRGNLLDVLRQQYILAARAKGLPENRVIYHHALRNAINPLVTIFGYQLSGLLSGAALTEIICNWPGLGSLLLAAVRAQDIYLVMGSMLMGGILLLAGNLFADIMLAWVDPRIRYE
ncbi:MAG: ABC transporter permease [Candidatus Omnitrophota bacterium]